MLQVNLGLEIRARLDDSAPPQLPNGDRDFLSIVR